MSFEASDRKRMNFWNTVLAGLFLLVVGQSFYAINWAGQVEQRIEGLKSDVTVIKSQSEVVIRTAATVAQMQQRNEELQNRLTRIEEKLDRLIERFSIPPRRYGDP